MGNRVMVEGYELTDDPALNWAKWTIGGLDVRGAGNAISYSPLNKHHGHYCQKALVAAGNSGNNGWCLRSQILSGGANSVNPLYMRVYVLLDQTPGSPAFTFMDASSLISGTTAVCYWGVSNTGLWYMNYRNAAAFTAATGTAWVANRIYCVEGAYYNDKVGANGWAKMWVDGKLVISVSGLTSDRDMLWYAVGSCFSTANAANNTSSYIDCVVVSNGYIGPESPVWSSRSHQTLRTKRGKSGRVGSLYLK